LSAAADVTVIDPFYVHTGSTFLPASFFSAKSVAKFTVSCPSSVCTFSDDGKTVIVICHDGTFYRCRFSSKGEPEMTIQNFLTGGVGSAVAGAAPERNAFGINAL
jgi:hypothetical protein